MHCTKVTKHAACAADVVMHIRTFPMCLFLAKTIYVIVVCFEGVCECVTPMFGFAYSCVLQI